MAKPTLHMIPLLEGERDFVVYVLRKHVDAGKSDLAPVGAMIASTQSGSDGLVEVVVEDADRERVRCALSRSALIGIGLDVYADTQNRKMIEWMFWGYALDTELLRRLLHRAPKVLYTAVSKDDLGFKMRRDVPRWLFERCYYVDNVHATVNADTRLSVVKAVADYLAGLGCCELKPAQVRKGMHPRIRIDWSPDMYVAHPARRPQTAAIPVVSLCSDDTDALAALAA